MTRKLANPELQPKGRRKVDSMAPPPRKSREIPVFAPPGASPLARVIAPFKNIAFRPYDTLRGVMYPQDRIISAVINAVAERGPVSLQEAYRIYFRAMKNAEQISIFRRAGDDTLAGHTKVRMQDGEVVAQRLNKTMDPMTDALISRAMEYGTVFFLQNKSLLYIDPKNPDIIRSREIKRPADTARIVLPLGKKYGLIEVEGEDLRFKGLYTPGSATIVSARDISRLFSLRFIADVDALTGLYSRGAFEESIRHQIDLREGETKLNTAMLMLDIDHFKRVNDTYGHAAGDKVLGIVAAITAMALRASDLVTKNRRLLTMGEEVSRYGGEEFAVLLPGSNTEGAAIAAMRCRQAIERHPITLPSGEKIQVTASIGIASLSDAERIVKGELDINPEFMMEVADEDFENQILLPGNGERVKSLRGTWQKISDEALYFAKHEGRNMVVAPEFVQDPRTGNVFLKFHAFR
jgi:diguanylate cyclase (GGDEF)-like protein